MPYSLRATTSGKQHALALPKKFVDEHPEFADGRFSAHVVAPGHVLISAEAPAVEPTEEDPVVGTFLAFLEQEMRAQPGTITPFSVADIQGLDELLDGVVVNRDEDLGDFTLP